MGHQYDSIGIVIVLHCKFFYTLFEKKKRKNEDAGKRNGKTELLSTYGWWGVGTVGRGGEGDLPLKNSRISKSLSPNFKKALY